MASNVLQKSEAELRELKELGLLYIGPESGDDPTLKRIAKGSTAAEHVEAAQRAHAAGMKLSVIFLLGAGGAERSEQHARGSAELATAMDPRFLSALTLTVVPGRRSRAPKRRGCLRSPTSRRRCASCARWSRRRRPPTPSSGPTTRRTASRSPAACPGTVTGSSARSTRPSAATSRCGQTGCGASEPSPEQTARV